MIIVTTPYLSDHRVVEMKGHVFGLVVGSRGLAGNMAAFSRSLGGGEIHEYTRSSRTLVGRRSTAWSERDRAGRERRALVPLRQLQLGGSMSEIVAYGTAVIVAPDDGTRAGAGLRRDVMLILSRLFVIVVGVILVAFGLWIAGVENEGSLGLVLVGLLTAFMGVVIIGVLSLSSGCGTDRQRLRSPRTVGPAGGEAPSATLDPRFQATDEVFVDPFRPARGRASSRIQPPGSGATRSRPDRRAPRVGGRPLAIGWSDGRRCPPCPGGPGRAAIRWTLALCDMARQRRL